MVCLVHVCADVWFGCVVSILLIFINCTLSTKYILYSLCTVKYKYFFFHLRRCQSTITYKNVFVDVFVKFSINYNIFLLASLYVYLNILVCCVVCDECFQSYRWWILIIITVTPKRNYKQLAYTKKVCLVIKLCFTHNFRRKISVQSWEYDSCLLLALLIYTV